MKKRVLFVFLFSCFSVFGQGNFELPKGVTSNKIDFQFLSNLVIVPVELNGVSLDFLLDTGVNATILFSIEKLEIEVEDLYCLKKFEREDNWKTKKKQI